MKTHHELRTAVSRKDSKCVERPLHCTIHALRSLLGLCLILAVGLGVRVAVLAEWEQSASSTLPHMDGSFHDQAARDLAGAPPALFSQFATFHYDSTPYFRPPGYIYFLAAIYSVFGAGYTAPHVVQIVLGLLNVVLIWRLYRQLFWKCYSLLAAAAGALYWILIYYERQLYEATLMTTLLLLLCIALFRVARVRTAFSAGLAGVALGLGAWVRPNLLACGLPIVVWLFLAVRQASGWRWFRGIVAFCAAILLTLAPVTLRNWVKSGEFVLVSCNMGVNLYAGNHETSNGYTPGGPLLGVWNCFDYPAICSRIGQRTGTPATFTSANRYFTQQALEFISQNPATVLRFLWTKTLLFWGPLEVGNEEEEELEREHSPILRNLPGQFYALMCLFGTGILLFVLGARRGGLPCTTQQKQLGFLVLGIMLVYFLSYLPFIVAARYRSPLIPLMILFATAATGFLCEQVLQKQWFRGFVWLGIVCVLAFVFSRNVADYIPNRANWHVQRANTHGKLQQFDDVILECKAALDINPKLFPVYLTLGNAYFSKRDIENAIASYRIACQKGSLEAAARNNLAWLLLERNEEVPEAIRWAEEACEITGFTDANFMHTLADGYAKANRIEEARHLVDKALRVARNQGDVSMVETLEQKKKTLFAGTP